MTCVSPRTHRLNLEAFTNEAFGQLIALKKDGILRDLTGYTLKAAVDVRSPAVIPFVVTWLPLNPDWHFMFSLPLSTMAAIIPGSYQWDWLLIDPIGIPTNKPGGLFTVYRGVTVP
jgi:hypothetical protein